MDKINEMVRIAYNALEDKKGENISIIDISGISPLADYFIITNGTSDSQVRALVDNVEEKCMKPDILRYKEKECSLETGCFLTTVILLFISLIRKIVNSII